MFMNNHLLADPCTEFLHLFPNVSENASLDQRPSNIIVKTGIPARYIAIAALLLAECSPICLAVKPNVSAPMAVVASRRRFNK
jgi:hypothetical protein